MGTVVLFVGRLTILKGIPELLSALSILAANRDLLPWSALFVGSGPLAPKIEEWGESHPHVPVALAGFVQPHELANYYAAADLFVMPSLIDRWSLVCLDALIAGIPQVTSSLNGGAVDLITSSEIGAIVDPRDAQSLANHLADRIRVGPQQVPEMLCDHAMNEWSTASMVKRAMLSIRSVVRDR
jgi:glycosyltransferase involved in cell wall biosynthesis